MNPRNLIVNFPIVFTGSPVRLDLGVIFGASGPEATIIFTAQKAFVRTLLDKYDISTNSTLVGIISYGRDASVNVKFGDALSKEATRNAIQKLNNPGNGANVNRAFELAKTSLFSETAGARRGAPKSLLLFVNRKLTENEKQSIKLIKDLEDSGVKVVVIGVGDDVDNGQLQNFVSSKKDLFLPKRIKELQKEIDGVRKALLPGIIF